MSEQKIDIEAIMAEIREEAKKHAGEDRVMSFEEVKMTSAITPRDWSVTCAYPPSGNPLKRLYTRVVSKASRAALFPLTENLTRIHREMKQQMDEMAATIEDQRAEIDALNERLDRLERENGKKPCE